MSMTWPKYLGSYITLQNAFRMTLAALIPAVAKMYEDSEVARLTRFRDRSAMFGRPPPPPGVEEIPSW